MAREIQPEASKTLSSLCRKPSYLIPVPRINRGKLLVPMSAGGSPRTSGNVKERQPRLLEKLEKPCNQGKMSDRRMPTRKEGTKKTELE